MNTYNLVHMILAEIVLPFTILGVSSLLIWGTVKRLVRLRERVARIRQRMDTDNE